ncbi:MAG: hypothetical protein H6728_16415 [Myxococcales bacterium]|nr:hypothetical protein [Myxococcales bacterium]
MACQKSSCRSVCRRCGGLGWLCGCLLVWCFCSGYTWKGRGKKGSVYTTPPPYLLLAQQAIQSRDMKAAVRVMEAARACWDKHKQACGFARHDYLMLAGVMYLEGGEAPRAVHLLRDAQMALATVEKAAIQKAQKGFGEGEDARNKAKIHKEEQARREKTRISLWFYLGQALFRAERYQEAAKALTSAQPVGQTMAGYYRLLAKAWERSGETEKARKSLLLGRARHPKDLGLLRELALLYAKAGLFQAAGRFAKELEAKKPHEALPLWLAILDQMGLLGASRQSLTEMESLWMRFPKSEALLLRRCVGFAKAKLHRAAASCFAVLARKKPEMSYYAAASSLQAGDLFQALRWNARIPKESQRIQQRAAIFLMQRDYARVFALLLPFWRTKKLQASECYRLAYAALQIGRFQEAEALLRSLQGSTYSSMARELQRVLGRCREAPWLCVR